MAMTARITGQLTDFGFDPLQGHDPVLVFKHVRPGIAGTAILSTKRIEIYPLYNGYFEADLVPSARISPAGYYTVTLEWTAPPGRRRYREEFPGRLYVPAEGGALADILRVPANPGLVEIGKEPPINPSPGSWWMDFDGNLSEYNGTGWTFKQNLRGPAGYNAVGAEASMAAVAAWIKALSGPNAVSSALTAGFVSAKIDAAGDVTLYQNGIEL